MWMAGSSRQGLLHSNMSWPSAVIQQPSILTGSTVQFEMAQEHYYLLRQSGKGNQPVRVHMLHVTRLSHAFLQAFQIR